MKRRLIIILACMGIVVTIGLAALGLNRKTEDSDIAGRDFDWYKAYVDKYMYMDNVSLNLFRDGLSDDAKLYITWNVFKPVNYSFSYDEINQVYKSLFDGEFPKENIENKKYCMAIYDYDKSKNTFEIRPVVGGCGGADTTPRYSTISKIIDYGDTFVAEVAFGKGEREEYAYDTASNTSFKLPLINNETATITCDYMNCDKEFESRYSKLKRYYFTFIKKEGGYVLKDLSNSYQEEKRKGNPYVISYNRHSRSWYLENTKKQIIADDNYDIFDINGEIDDKIKVYMSINKSYSYTDYLEANDKYEEITGDYLKKQDIYINECYDLKFYDYDKLEDDGMAFYKSGAFKNIKSNNTYEWREKCGTDRSGTVRVYEVRNITENNDGYTAEVDYLQATIKSNEDTSEVWYELDLRDGKKNIDCGYDKNSCKEEKVREYFKNNKQNIRSYKLTFNINKEREAIRSVSPISN